MENFIFDLQRFDGWQNATSSSIEYQQGSNTLFTIDGLSKSDYLTADLENKVVAVGEAALWARAKDTITIDNDYTFSFGDSGASAIYGTLGGAGWYETLNNHVTFNIAGLSDYFTLESGTITYHEETLGAAQVELSGVSNIDTLTDPTETTAVMLNQDNFYQNGSISVLGNSAAYQFMLMQGDYSGLTFNGSSGSDTISNGYGTNISINSGDGDDTINNFTGTSSTINAGAGNDSVWNTGGVSSVIYLGEGNDTILNTPDHVTIYGGDDNDSIKSSISRYTLIDGGDGNDTIENSDNKENYSTVLGGAGDDYITNSGINVSINGGEGNDTIDNWNYSVTINGGEGADSIYNRSDNVLIDGGDGANTITSTGQNVTITNSGDKSSITGGSGTDSISNTGSYVSINTGEGDDYVYNSGSNLTINGGTGDDTIENAGGSNIFFQYNSGDGNDIINGFGANDTLYFVDVAHKTSVSGDDLIITSGDNKITLSGAASLDNLNITGTYDEQARAFVTNLQQKTALGYPIIAALAFHPNEYHGFETLPEEYYAASETLNITSSDGLELTGYHYTPENSNDKWAVIVHGYGHNHKHMNGFAQMYLLNGYNVLMVDQRAAGESEGDWLTMGVAEGNDVALWTQKIAEINPNAKIILHGVSMGAATAMLAAANPNATNVVSLVEDCGYTNVINLVDILKEALKDSNPKLSAQLSNPEFIEMIDTAAETLTGYKLTAAAPIDSIGNATMPSIFISGDSDSVVPMSNLDSLYTASGAGVKEIFTVAGATHALSALTDSIGYANAVFRFNAEAAGEGWVTSNVTDAISLRGTKYDDVITNSGASVMINVGDGADFITNSGSDVTINGGESADTISNSGANSSIDGGAGDDYISSDSNESTIDGDEGADTIDNSGSNVSINGGEGADSINNSGSNVSINGGAGNDTLTGGAGKDFFIYTSGADVITNYTLGEDVISLGAEYTTAGLVGDDYVFNFGGGSSLTLKDIKIDDELTFINASGSTIKIIALPLGLSYNDDKTALTASSLFSGNEINLGDYNSKVRSIDASALSVAVNLVGNNYSNTLTGGAGADSLTGGKVNDTFVYTSGADVITDYTTGEDIISLNTTATYVGGLNGSDYVFDFGSGSSLTLKDVEVGDKLRVVNASGSSLTINALLKGLSFNENETGLIADTLFAESEINLGDYDNKVRSIDAAALSSAIKLVGNNYSNTLAGGAGSDSLTGGAGNDLFVFGGGSDVITDYATGDRINLGGATVLDAVVNGNELILDLGNGNSLALNGAAKDKIKFQDGSKFSYNYFGNHAIIDATNTKATLTAKATGFDAADFGNLIEISAAGLSTAIVITGNSKSNKIYAGAGSATLNGGIGSDTLFGGAGIDTFVYNNNSGNKVIANYAAGETISLVGGTLSDASLAGNGDAVLKVGTKKITVKGAKGKEITIGENGANKYFLDGAIYNADKTVATLSAKYSSTELREFDNTFTTIDASAVKSKLNLKANSATGATLLGSKSNDTLTGGTGADYIDGGKNNDYLSGGDGSDTLLGGKGKDLLYGGAGADSLLGEVGNDLLNGDDGNDYLDGGKGRDSLTGGAGADSLFGGEGGDKINGGDGDDYIVGGKGNDSLWGDDGADTFAYASGDGKDVIFGFGNDDTLTFGNLELTSAKVNSSGTEISLKVGTTSRAITFKEFTATEFNINGATYTINGGTLAKK